MVGVVPNKYCRKLQVSWQSYYNEVRNTWLMGLHAMFANSSDYCASVILRLSQNEARKRFLVLSTAMNCAMLVYSCASACMEMHMSPDKQGKLDWWRPPSGSTKWYGCSSVCWIRCHFWKYHCWFLFLIFVWPSQLVLLGSWWVTANHWSYPRTFPGSGDLPFFIKEAYARMQMQSFMADWGWYTSRQLCTSTPAKANGRVSRMPPFLIILLCVPPAQILCWMAR